MLKRKPIEITSDGKGIRFYYFNHELHKYTFENRCNELPELVLGDEATKIFLCAGGNANDVSDDMKDFLEWLTTGKPGNSKLVNNLDKAVQKAKDHEEWRVEFMTLQMRDQEMMKKGKNIERLNSIRNMIKCDVPKEKILEHYSQEEYELAASSERNK